MKTVLWFQEAEQARKEKAKVAREAKKLRRAERVATERGITVDDALAAMKSEAKIKRDAYKAARVEEEKLRQAAWLAGAPARAEAERRAQEAWALRQEERRLEEERELAAYEERIDALNALDESLADNEDSKLLMPKLGDPVAVWWRCYGSISRGHSRWFGPCVGQVVRVEEEPPVPGRPRWFVLEIEEEFEDDDGLWCAKGSGLKMKVFRKAGVKFPTVWRNQLFDMKKKGIFHAELGEIEEAA
jgi:hypothetical protein